MASLQTALLSSPSRQYLSQCFHCSQTQVLSFGPDTQSGVGRLHVRKQSVGYKALYPCGSSWPALKAWWARPAIPHLLASGHWAAVLPSRCAWPGSQVPGVLVQGVKVASRRELLQRRLGRRTPAAAASRSLQLLSNHGLLVTRSFCPCDQTWLKCDPFLQ